MTASSDDLANALVRASAAGERQAAATKRLGAVFTASRQTRRQIRRAEIRHFFRRLLRRNHIVKSETEFSGHLRAMGAAAGDAAEAMRQHGLYTVGESGIEYGVKPDDDPDQGLTSCSL